MPIEELELLRRRQLILIEDKPLDEANNLLKDIKGDMLEIRVELEAGTCTQLGIKLRRSPVVKKKRYSIMTGRKRL